MKDFQSNFYIFAYNAKIGTGRNSVLILLKIVSNCDRSAGISFEENPTGLQTHRTWLVPLSLATLDCSHPRWYQSSDRIFVYIGCAIFAVSPLEMCAVDPRSASPSFGVYSAWEAAPLIYYVFVGGSIRQEMQIDLVDRRTEAAVANRIHEDEHHLFIGKEGGGCALKYAERRYKFS